MTGPIETISWESGGRRHWSGTGVDWLAVRWGRTDPDSSLTLHEGSHHHFSELIQYNEEGGELMRLPLTGPGPFELQLNADNPGLVMVKVEFINYSLSPLDPGETDHLVSCGFLDRRNERQHIYMAIQDQGQQGEQPQSLPPSEEFVTSPPHSYPTLLPDLDNPQVGLILDRTYPAGTIVWFAQSKFLKQQAAEARMNLGAEFPLNSIAVPLESVTIAANTRSPQKAPPAAHWNLAIPVRESSSGKGMLGMPLLHKRAEPIKNFSLRFQGTEIRASWEWTLPLPWVDVLLWWYISMSPEGLGPLAEEELNAQGIYTAPELSDEWVDYYRSHQKLDVDWRYYQRFSKPIDNPGAPLGSVKVNLPIDRRAWRQKFKGSTLSVIACPRLFGTELSEHQKDAVVYL